MASPLPLRDRTPHRETRNERRRAVRGGGGVKAALVLSMLAGGTAVEAAPGAPASGAPLDSFAVQIMASYAQCAVARNPKMARTIVGADYRTEAYQRAIRDFAQDERSCVQPGGRLRFSQLIFAGDMAESLMRRDGVDAATLHRALSQGRGVLVPNGPMMCVVRKQPDEVFRLLEAKPASAEESAAIGPLKNALADCTPKRKRVVTNSAGFRAMLALSAYRLATVQPVAAGPEG